MEFENSIYYGLQRKNIYSLQCAYAYVNVIIESLINDFGFMVWWEIQNVG